MNKNPIDFFVPGVPAPGGSKKAFIVNGRASLTDASGEKGKDWRRCVQEHAATVMDGADLLTMPLRLHVIFHMPRPKAHFGTGRNSDKLKASAPKYHDKKPDTTKLLRALEDALTGIVWRDDAQVVAQFAVKRYTSGTCGASVYITQDIETRVEAA